MIANPRIDFGAQTGRFGGNFQSMGMLLPVTFRRFEAEGQTLIGRRLVAKTCTASIANKNIGHQCVQQQITEGECHQDRQSRSRLVVRIDDGAGEGSHGDEDETDTLWEILLTPEIRTTAAEAFRGARLAGQPLRNRSGPVAVGTSNLGMLDLSQDCDVVTPRAAETDVHVPMEFTAVWGVVRDEREPVAKYSSWDQVGLVEHGTALRTSRSKICLTGCVADCSG